MEITNPVVVKQIIPRGVETFRKMNKILFLLNVRSGRGSAANLEDQVRTFSRDNNIDAHIVHLRSPGDFQGLEGTINNSRPDLVVAGGGDGTVNAVASVIKNMDIPLGILPLGSANSLAFELGIPSDPLKSLEKLVSGKPKPMDILVINDEWISLHMCDFGMNARVIKRRESEGVKGFFGYAYQYFKELFRKQEFTVTIRSGEQNITTKTIMVILANASYFGTGAEFSPEGSLDDGVFEVVVVEAYPTWYLFHLFLSIFRKNNKNNNLTRTFQFSEAAIEASPPEDLQIDGEPVGKKNRVYVCIQKRALQVIC
jgi:YegS/Rv2252/BmrU family lipid kinase